MEPVYEMTKKQNFLSVDGKVARNSYGEFFIVGEVVGHENEEAGSATIIKFEAKLDEDEITVYTNEGSAHLDFITKFPYVEKEPTGFSIIKKERKRQIAVEGWTAEHDDMHTDESIALAAAAYAMPGSSNLPTWWPWSLEWWKPSPDNRIKELAKAGALICAEIDRLLRIKNK